MKKAHSGSTPSVKPAMGDYGGDFRSTPSSNAGASGRSYTSGPFKTNPKQKPAKSATSGYRNTTGSGDPGNKGY